MCVCVCVCREKAPGQRECDEAIDVLNSCIREVDQASLAAISQQLSPREDISQEVNHVHGEHYVEQQYTPRTEKDLSACVSPCGRLSRSR